MIAKIYFFLVLFTLLFSTLKAQKDTTQKQVVLRKLDIEAKIDKTLDEEKAKQFTMYSQSGKSLADQLSKLLGVTIRKSSINTNKPIIDGMSSSRLIYVVNGVRIENQDWADAHQPEIATELATELSIISSGDAVKHGAGAIGGIINISSGTIPNTNRLNGKMKAFFDSNTKGWGNSMTLQQHSKRIKPLYWRVAGTMSNAGDHHTPNYNLGNSGERLHSWQTEIKWLKRRWSASLFYSDYYNLTGNSFNILTGNIEEFEERIQVGRPLTTLPYSYDLQYPVFESRHQIYNINLIWELIKNLELNAQVSYQFNQRREFEVRRNGRSHIASQNTTLDSKSYKLDLTYYYKDILTSMVGTKLRGKESVNIPGTGVVPSLPNYLYGEQSVYSTHKLLFPHWSLLLGGRYDLTYTSALGYDFLSKKYGKQKFFDGYSAQIASTYNIKNISFNSTLNHSWRTPEMYELYANGKQHGYPIYFIGDHNLNGEKGIKLSQKISYKIKEEEVVKGVITGRAYHQWIKDYIYATPMHEFKQLFTGPASIFRYQEKDAVIYGWDLLNKWNLTRKLTWQYQLSWIYGIEKENNNSLPAISPFRLTTQLEYKLPLKGRFCNSTLQLEHEFVGQKKKFYKEYELSKKVPNAYNVSHIALGTDFQLTESTLLNFTCRVDNIFNTEYKDYLNIHRYFYHERGRNIKLILQLKF